MSHPVRVRGLKQGRGSPQLSGCRVAPRAGAWIETSVEALQYTLAESHPVRVRGLKHLTNIVGSDLHVAPRAGAWIETMLMKPCL